jgi:hypothetical protein
MAPNEQITHATFFNKIDPFATAVALGQQYPIMVFEELVDGEHSTTHWLTNDPVSVS